MKEKIRRLEILLTRGDELTINLREKVKNASLTFDKLNKGKASLDDVLSLPQSNGSGLGFNKLNDSFPKFFESKKDVITFSKEKGNSLKKDKRFVCHYCEKPGHIAPFCSQKKKDKASRKMNVESNVTCNVVYTALRTNITGTWYFDSGCSTSWYLPCRYPRHPPHLR